jgi:hypothetical protein
MLFSIFVIMIIYVERVHLLCIIRCILHIYTCTRRSNYCRCFCVQVRLDLSFQYVGLPETPPPGHNSKHITDETSNGPSYTRLAIARTQD